MLKRSNRARGRNSGCVQLFGDAVVDRVGIGRRQPLLDAEDARGRMLEPEPGRRAAKQVPVPGEEAPDRARIGLDRAAVLAGDAELLQPHALRIEHPEDVVVRLDEQRRRDRERLRSRRTSADRCGRAAR